MHQRVRPWHRPRRPCPQASGVRHQVGRAFVPAKIPWSREARKRDRRTLNAGRPLRHHALSFAGSDAQTSVDRDGADPGVHGQAWCGMALLVPHGSSSANWVAKFGPRMGVLRATSDHGRRLTSGAPLAGFASHRRPDF